MSINEELLEKLACPGCKGDLRLSETGDTLLCDSCALSFPIKDDIPIMLLDEATKL